MRVLVLLGAFLTLAGCASSSSVVDVGGGAYRVTSTAITSFGGSATANGDALKKAAAACEAKGLKMQVVDAKSSANIANGSADVTFTCVPR